MEQRADGNKQWMPFLLLEIRAGIMGTKVELDVVGIMSMGRQEVDEFL